jgi:ABC-type glycerol-3-phosphate transport system substrate-binding protein
VLAFIYFMKRSKLLASALLVVLPFILTACTLKDLPVIGKYLPDWPGGGGGSDFPTQEVTLNVWGLWENSDVIDSLVQKYQEIHPNVKVNYEDRSVLKPIDYKESVYTRLTQEGSTAGDIVFVHNSWVPAIKDNLEPAPDSLMTADRFNSSFYPAASQSAVFSGKVYALPLYYDGLVLVYNKKHFADINQSAPPASWEEFRRLALELTVRGSERSLVRAGAAIGGAKNIEFASDILGLLFSQANLSIPGDLDEKAAFDALSFYTNFLLVDRVWDENLPEASAAFTQEKVSMIFVPSWNLLDILDARPDWAMDGNIGVAPVPQALIDEPVNWASFWMATVPAKSPNKQVAWDFVNFITEEAQQKAWFDEASKTRAYGPIYSRSTLAGELASNPFLAPFTEEALTAKTGILVSRAGNKTANDAMLEAINHMVGGKRGNAEGALKAAQEKLLGTH